MTRKKKKKKKKKPNRCGGIEWFLIYFDGQHLLGEAISFQIFQMLILNPSILTKPGTFTHILYT